MMKKMNGLKIFQLIVLIVFSGGAIFLAFTDNTLLTNLAANRTTMIVFGLMWLVLLISFIFVFIDFQMLSALKNRLNTLSKAAYSDYLSGIPNRFSCDMLLEKYSGIDAPLTISCIMIQISSLFAVNKQFGRSQGNELLKQFSDILTTASEGLCFTGRNGGDKFLAVFEDSNQSMIDIFIKLVEHGVSEHNSDPKNHQIEFKVGIAQNKDEKLKNLVELITLSNKRITE